MAQCTAKSKRSGQPCQRAAMHGRNVCHNHGGKSKIGAASGTFKHGRYSKVLPTRLAARYAQGLANPDLLSLKDDLATCEARLADLLQRVDSGESGHLWQAITQTNEACRTALAAGDILAMRDHFRAMYDLIHHGSADHAAWAEIEGLWKTRARLTQAEVKLLITQQQMVTVEQLMTYFGLITETIRQAVLTHADPDTGRAILGEISAAFQHLSTLLEA